MARPFPASSRVAARVAFLRALAVHTGAIGELRAWPRLTAIRDADLPPAFVPDSADGLADSFPSLSREDVVAVAGPERLAAAQAWAAQSRLEGVDWLEDWAVFAMVAFDFAQTSGWLALDALDDVRAVDLLAAPRIMRRLEAETDGVWACVEVSYEDSIYSESQYLPRGLTPVVPPLLGPHPLMETREEFFHRAHAAWDEAVAEIAKQGHTVTVPRKLELHCEWLVRYHVRGQTAAEIVADLEETDTSTVYKAVRSMAQVIGLSLRVDLN